MKIEKIEKKKFGSRVARPHSNEGKNDLLCTQLVANNYFDTAELLGPRAPIILAKENNCLQHIGRVRARVCPRLGSFFLHCILAWRIGISWRLISCPPRTVHRTQRRNAHAVPSTLSERVIHYPGNQSSVYNDIDIVGA